MACQTTTILGGFALLLCFGVLLAAPASAQICEATGAGKCYYISNKVGTGSGTFVDPYGMADLPDSTVAYCKGQGTAIKVLRPGDYLYFRGGAYNFVTCGGSTWAQGYISPLMSGTPSAPITFAAYPGETVTVTKSGAQPAFGTFGPSGGMDYIRFIGFTLKSSKMSLFDTVGSEAAYNDIEGTNSPGNNDTNVALYMQDAHSTWVHHNIIHGSQGNTENNAGIQVFRGVDNIVEDNYLYNNIANINDKENGLRNTYRRNLLTQSRSPWYGNNQPPYGKWSFASYYVYDNVVDGGVELHYLTNGAEVHDNLIRGSKLSGAWAGETWNSHVWNNIVIAPGAALTAYYEDKNTFIASEPNPHLRYMDYNFYTLAPRYQFGKYNRTNSMQTFDLAQMQAKGYEQHSQTISAQTIFSDLTSYTLSSSFISAGRYGDMPGPDNIAEILDLTRYGPAARPGSGLPPLPPTDNTPPSVPTGLIASGISATGITVTWSASVDAESGIASYRVYRNGALVHSPTAMMYGDAGLSASTQYSYAVSAVNGEGLESARSQILSVSTLATVAPPKEDVTADGIINGADVYQAILDAKQGYIARSDMNNDGVITLIDFVLIAQRI